MTVEQIWEYGKEKPELFSRYRGKAQALENGNCLGTFNQETEAGLPCDTIYVEVDKEKSPVWECYSASKLQDNAYQDYQLIRRPLYREPQYINLEETVRNFIPKEVLSDFES